MADDFPEGRHCSRAGGAMRDVPKRPARGLRQRLSGEPERPPSFPLPPETSRPTGGNVPCTGQTRSIWGGRRAGHGATEPRPQPC